MHANYIFKFKLALYFSTLLIKLLTVVESYFKPKLLPWSWNLAIFTTYSSTYFYNQSTLVLLLPLGSSYTFFYGQYDDNFGIFA